MAGTFGAVTSGLVKATRRPWLGSRITRDEERWLLGLDPPWRLVPVGASLVDADPGQPSGLYDDASRLWAHFTGRPGFSTAKISKVLYMMRPHFFPLLDSHLLRTYSAARELGCCL